MEGEKDRVESSCSQTSLPDIQSPLDEELQDLDEKEEATVTPEPGAETEIEIAANAGHITSSDSGSETNRGREAPSSGLSQKLAGILGPRPGSGLSSRKDSGCSTPARSEALEYHCHITNTSTENKMSIICHYNPIMDEYISLTDDAEDDQDKEKVEDETDLLFELCKDDFPALSSLEQTINVGTFLNDLETTGIRRDDKRLANLMAELDKIKDQDNSFGPCVDNLNLNKETFKRVVKEDFQIISKAFKNQFKIPKFGDFCSVIRDIYAECKDITEGKVASYIPQLASYDPAYWGVSICTVDGQRFSLGDVTTPFTMQSCSKPFTYAVCLNELGSERVHQYVGQEPSGRMFNNLCLDYSNKPHNPLLNSGAIMSCAILLSIVKPELPMSEKFDLVVEYFSKMSGEEGIGFNNSVFLSERDTADRNFALAYFMKENKCFPPGFNLQETLDFYFQTCSLETTCESLSVLGGCLANGGVCPTTQERVLSSQSVRDVLSLMHSCGMYNYSGQFAFKVGLPAKSGVSGSLVLVVPGVMGIALWSPPLDNLGNSVRGVAFAEKFIDKFNFHRFDNLVHLRSKIDPRKHRYDVCQQTVVSLLYSATTGDVTALRRFESQGLDMCGRDYDGRTALHLSAAEGHSDCVKFLVQVCRVSPLVTDRWGFTPLLEAQRFHHSRVVDFLLSHIKDHLPDRYQASLDLVQQVQSKQRSKLSVK